jgi:hypothetical protein
VCEAVVMLKVCLSITVLFYLSVCLLKSYDVKGPIIP